VIPDHLKHSCEGCGESFDVNEEVEKGSAVSCTSEHAVIWCPSCGKLNIINFEEENCGVNGR